MPISSDDKKVRYKLDCYILHTFLLVTILIFIIAKPLHIIWYKVDGFIRDYGGTKYFLKNEKNDAIYERIKHLVRLKSGITYIFSHKYAKLKIDSVDDLPLQEKLTLHNAVIFIKSVFNKSQITTAIIYF